MNCANRRGGVRAGVLAFLFVVACAAGGAVIAACWERPLYRSTAVLRVLAQTADGEPAVNPMVDSIIPEMLHSARLIERGIASERWKQHGLQPLNPVDYARHVHCVLHPELHTVEVSMLAADPNSSASVALTALLESYSSVDGEMRASRFDRRRDVFDSLQQSLRNNLDAFARESQELGSQYGGVRLQRTLDFTRSQLEKIESLQLEMKIALATQNDGPTSAPAASGEKGALNASEQRVEKLHQELRAKLLEVGHAAARLSVLDDETAFDKERLHEVKRRIAKLQVESQFAQGVTFSEATVPRQPECRWCSHRVTWSAGFGGGGALLLVLLIAAFYRGS